MSAEEQINKNEKKYKKIKFDTIDEGNWFAESILTLKGSNEANCLAAPLYMSGLLMLCTALANKTWTQGRKNIADYLYHNEECLEGNSPYSIAPDIDSYICADYSLEILLKLFKPQSLLDFYKKVFSKNICQDDKIISYIQNSIKEKRENLTISKDENFFRKRNCLFWTHHGIDMTMWTDKLTPIDAFKGLFNLISVKDANLISWMDNNEKSINTITQKIIDEGGEFITVLEPNCAINTNITDFVEKHNLLIKNYKHSTFLFSPPACGCVTYDREHKEVIYVAHILDHKKLLSEIKRKMPKVNSILCLELHKNYIPPKRNKDGIPYANTEKIDVAEKTQKLFYLSSLNPQRLGFFEGFTSKLARTLMDLPHDPELYIRTLDNNEKSYCLRIGIINRGSLIPLVEPNFSRVLKVIENEAKSVLSFVRQTVYKKTAILLPFEKLRTAALNYKVALDFCYAYYNDDDSIVESYIKNGKLIVPSDKVSLNDSYRLSSSLNIDEHLSLVVCKNRYYGRCEPTFMVIDAEDLRSATKMCWICLNEAKFVHKPIKKGLEFYELSDDEILKINDFLEKKLTSYIDNEDHIPTSSLTKKQYFSKETNINDLPTNFDFLVDRYADINDCKSLIGTVKPDYKLLINRRRKD